MKKRNYILIAVILLLAAAFALGGLLRRDGGDTVRIYLDGALYAELPRSRDGETVIEQPDGRRNVVEISGGRVRMREANCPTGTCVACGWRDADALLPADGWIICLPNRVAVEVAGK